MSTSVYTLNKGINKPIEFKGLKAQYIWYLGGGVVLLLILFAILYICQVPPLICVGLVFILGVMLFMYVYQLSNKYGPYGMMKKLAKKAVPNSIRNNSRKLFIELCKKN